MPDEKQEVKDIQGEVLQNERTDNEGKKRIRPVIEEIPAADGVSSKEEKTEQKEKEEKKEEKKGEIAKETPPYEKQPEVPEEESKSDLKLFIVIAVITAIVVAALAGGIYVYITGTRSLGSSTPTPAATIPPEVSPVSTPTSSPSATPKLSGYRVQILNGSGKIGEANKAKAVLTKAGFKVSDTGNAATFDFTDTMIQAKADVPEEVLLVAKDALSSTYSVKIGDKLDSAADFDIIVTLGSK